MRDLLFYYAFPNNAFKYRLKGEYAVKGVERLIDKVNRQFSSFIRPFAYLMSSSTKHAGARREWLVWLNAALASVRLHDFTTRALSEAVNSG